MRLLLIRSAAALLLASSSEAMHGSAYELLALRYNANEAAMARTADPSQIAALIHDQQPVADCLSKLNFRRLSVLSGWDERQKYQPGISEDEYAKRIGCAGRAASEPSSR